MGEDTGTRSLGCISIYPWHCFVAANSPMGRRQISMERRPHHWPIRCIWRLDFGLLVCTMATWRCSYCAPSHLSQACSLVMLHLCGFSWRIILRRRLLCKHNQPHVPLSKLLTPTPFNSYLSGSKLFWEHLLQTLVSKIYP